MAKINKIPVYPYDLDVSENDHLIGTDTNDDNLTKNFRIENILELVKTSSIISGEYIPKYTPVAVVDGLAYKLDSLNSNHIGKYYGFSKNESFIGDYCKIVILGELKNISWNLIPGQIYFAGPNGSILEINNVINSFTKIVCYAISETKIKIINELSSDFINLTDNRVINEVPAGNINGSNAVFTSINNFIPETVEVFSNGQKLKIIDDYNLSSNDTITLMFSPGDGESITINYKKI